MTGGNAAPDCARRRVWRTAGAFAAIFAVALLLRAWALGRNPLWYDETMFAHFSSNLSLRALAEAVPNEPLFAWFLHGWVLLGRSEAWLRLPALCMGMGAVAAAYLTGKQAAGARGGLMSMLLVAVAPFLVWYSRDAKMYAWVACLELLLVYVTLRYAEERGSWRELAVYVLLGAALFHTHRISALFVASLNVMYLACFARKPRETAAWCAAQGVLLLCCLPYGWVLFRFLQETEGKVFWAAAPTWRSLGVTAASFTVGYSPRPWLRLAGPAACAVLALPALARVDWAHRRKTLLLLGTALGQVALLYAVSRMLGKSLYVDRYLAGSAALLLVVAGVGLARVPGAALRTIVALCLAGLLGAGLPDLYSRRMPANWLDRLGVPFRLFDSRGVAAHIQARARADDQVWDVCRSSDPATRWYLPGFEHVLVDFGQRTQHLLDSKATRREQAAYGQFPIEADQLATANSRVWLIAPEPGAYAFPGMHQGLLPWLNHHGALREVVPFTAPYFPALLYLFDCTAQDNRLHGGLPVATVENAPLPHAQRQLSLELQEAPGARQRLLVRNLSNASCALSVETVFSDLACHAAAFRRTAPERSDWRFQPYRDRRRMRVAWHTRVGERPVPQDRLSHGIHLPPGRYRVHIQRLVQGEEYPAPTAELRLEVDGQVMRAPGALEGHGGGWAWCDAGEYVKTAAEDTTLYVSAHNADAAPEVLATFSLVVFRASETAIERPPETVAALVDGGVTKALPLPAGGRARRMDVLVGNARHCDCLWRSLAQETADMDTP